MWLNIFWILLCFYSSVCVFRYFYLFTEYHYATCADLQLTIPLPQSLECWDYRCHHTCLLKLLWPLTQTDLLGRSLWIRSCEGKFWVLVRQRQGNRETSCDFSFYGTSNVERFLEGTFVLLPGGAARRRSPRLLLIVCLYGKTCPSHVMCPCAWTPYTWFFFTLRV